MDQENGAARAPHAPPALPKRDVKALVEALRIRALALTGEKWERSATRDMMREAADLLEAQASRPAPPLDWQPIATAKPEGHILAFEMVPGECCYPPQPGKSFPNVFVAHWWRGDELNKARWQGGAYGLPTHWMPLPSPPAAHAAKIDG